MLEKAAWIFRSKSWRAWFWQCGDAPSAWSRLATPTRPLSLPGALLMDRLLALTLDGSAALGGASGNASPPSCTASGRAPLHPSSSAAGLLPTPGPTTIEQQRRTWGQHLSRKPQWPGWPLRGQRLGEAANRDLQHLAPSSAARGPASDSDPVHHHSILLDGVGAAGRLYCPLAAPARTPHGPKGGPANKP